MEATRLLCPTNANGAVSMDPGLRRDDGVAENTATPATPQINSTFDTT